LNDVKKSEGLVTSGQYEDLHQTFYRTLVKTRLSRGAAKAYFAYRVWTSGTQDHTAAIHQIFWEGIDEMNEMAVVVKNEFGNSPGGQWTWDDDLETVERYIQRMTQMGWDDYGGVVIPKTFP
jgi:hypothetical protein